MKKLILAIIMSMVCVAQAYAYGGTHSVGHSSAHPTPHYSGAHEALSHTSAAHEHLVRTTAPLMLMLMHRQAAQAAHERLVRTTAPMMLMAMHMHPEAYEPRDLTLLDIAILSGMAIMAFMVLALIANAIRPRREDFGISMR